MRKTLIYLAGFAVAVATLTVQARAQRGGTAQAPPADLVLTNGRIVTVDDGRPEAEAIAISKDRIQALGTAAEIKAMIGPQHAGHRPAGAARHSRVHREPRRISPASAARSCSST